MASVNTAQAHWEGSLFEGSGRVELVTSGVASFDVSWAARAESGAGTTNPEELIAAAHAGCFTMALSFALNNAGFTADAIDTEAIVSLEQQPAGGFAIPAVHLVTRARVPGIDAAKFMEIANGAKANCPVSKVLNATITMDASLSA